MPDAVRLEIPDWVLPSLQARFGADRVQDLERKAHAILQTAPVGIVAVIRDRRQEFMQEIAVRRMQLDAVEAESHGPLRGGHETVAHRAERRSIEGQRRMLPGRLCER